MPKNSPASDGALSLETKWRLAQKAFATTAAYDSAIASTAGKHPADFHLPQGKVEAFPQTLRLSFQKTLDLRYGENPHQKAAMYSDGSGVGVANARQLQGKELSYNNIVDLQAAWDLAQEFDRTSPSAPSSSTPIPPAPRLARLSPRPTSALSNAIRSQRSAA